MPYLVDSDILIDLLADDGRVASLLDELADDGLGTSAICYMEAYQGIVALGAPTHTRAAATRAAEILERVRIDFAFYPVDLAAARRCAVIRYDLSRQGARVRPRALDLLNAAIALEHGLVLVTRNTADFDDIPGVVLFADRRLRP